MLNVVQPPAKFCPEVRYLAVALDSECEPRGAISLAVSITRCSLVPSLRTCLRNSPALPCNVIAVCLVRKRLLLLEGPRRVSRGGEVSTHASTSWSLVRVGTQQPRCGA